MDYFTNIDNIPTKIAISTPFIVYVSILLFGILNQQLEMSAAFMFGVLLLYVTVSIFQMFYKQDNNQVELIPNECQFFDQHLFYQSYKSPSFPSSFLWFVVMSIVITLFTTLPSVNIPLIILIVVMCCIIIFRFNYTDMCNTSKIMDSIIPFTIGSFIAIIYYLIIIHTFMKMNEYMLFVRPKSNRKQCVTVTKSPFSSNNES